jgi:DNA-binding response OmpR family regulator
VERESSVLLVEDEPAILKGLSTNLEREGFDVLQADTGVKGIDLALAEHPDLVLLDVMMPGGSGLDVCKHLRQEGFQSPIIFLTARSESIDVVLGLELGADDYVTKPFDFRELVARIRARLRETKPVRPCAPTEYCIGPLAIDFERCRATRNGRPVEFTPRELSVLQLLIANRNELVTRDQMLNEVWGYDSYPTTRTVDMHILKIRQKIEADPSNPQHILSVYGSGYKFVD